MMTNSSTVLSGLVALSLLLGASAIEGCGYSTSDATTYPPAQGFTVQAGATTISLPQSGTVRTSIKATRFGGLAGAIAFSVTGAPTGLTATLANTGVPDSVTLVLTASATIAPATYPITVNATATGASSQQTTVTVTVSAVQTAAPLVEVLATGAHSCALTSTADAYCWGFNGNGELGNNDTSLANPIPVAVSGGFKFQVLSVSKLEGISCGLVIGGAAYCWGSNHDGQVGDGTKIRRLTPTPVAGGLSFKSIAVGNAHVCAIATSGTTYCWGTTPNGAFGDNSIGERLTPAVSAPGMFFQSVVSGSDFSCALTADGAAWCWGLGFQGQLGDGRALSSRTPVAVAGGLTFRALVAAAQSVCGLTPSGKAYCWGNNSYGQVGDGTNPLESGNTRRTTPVAVAGNLSFASISAGYFSICGVTDAGAGYCWGYNSSGAVGDGQLEHRSSPSAVSGGLTFRSISAGNAYSCGITTAYAVYCWGANDDGELGNGTFSANPTTAPVPVRWTQSGSLHTAASTQSRDKRRDAAISSRALSR